MAKSIKDYKIVDEIGTGGMGKVYKAVHPDLKTHVILKELSKPSRDFSQRFKREATIMTSLRHDNIAYFNDYFSWEGNMYIVMEYIDGIPLSELIQKRNKIDPHIVLLIMHEVARGLEYAHGKGVLHRDLKPQNILISKRGEVKIIDFGIASFREQAEESDATKLELTRTGMVMGTPAYMSPEHLSDMKKVTERSDIYSLGIIMYEMLTGERPYDDTFSTQAFTARMKQQYITPGNISKDIPAFFNRIIRHCLRANPARRYRNIGVLRKKLEKYIRRLSGDQLNRCISEYVFYKSMAEELSRMRPLYSSFTASFRESQTRKRLLIGSIATVLIMVVGYIFLVSNAYYHVFNRADTGILKIQYTLPLPGIRDLPDSEKYPGVYAEKKEAAEKKLYGFIDRWYKDMLMNFQIRAWLIRLNEKRRQLGVEDVLLTPGNVIALTPDDFKVELGNDRSIPDNLIFTSDTLYRDKGYYAVKIQFNSKAYWTHFTLNPINEQNVTRVITTPFSATPRSRISFEFNFIDLISEKQIPNVDIYMLRKYRGKYIWVDWEKLSDNKRFLENLYNGESYYFKFNHPDYKTGKSIKVYASKDDRVVNIRMKFAPKEPE